MQAEHLEKIRNENATLIEQNQNLLILYQNVFALLYLVNNHYYHRVFDYLFKIRSSVTINQMSLPIIILLYHNNNEEQGAKEERDDNRK